MADDPSHSQQPAGHDHGGHWHGVIGDAEFGRLAIALALILGFMGVEVLVGILASSLALLSRRCRPLPSRQASA